MEGRNLGERGDGRSKGKLLERKTGSGFAGGCETINRRTDSVNSESDSHGLRSSRFYPLTE